MHKAVYRLQSCCRGWKSSAEEEEEGRPSQHPPPRPLPGAGKHKAQSAGPVGLLCSHAHTASKGTENIASSAAEKGIKLLKESYSLMIDT